MTTPDKGAAPVRCHSIKSYFSDVRLSDSIRQLARKLTRRALLHLLPLLLMFLIAGWLTLKADALIQHSKQFPATRIGSTDR